MASKKSKRSLWDMKIVRRAAWDSLVKLHPVTMMRNPVMFVVEVGSVVTTMLLISGASPRRLRIQSADHAMAVVHGAVRELCRGNGRGPRQGAG